MIGITIVIVFFMLGVLLGVWAYGIGRKHGVVIGRAQLANEIIWQKQQQQRVHEDFIDSCKEEFENWE